LIRLFYFPIGFILTLFASCGQTNVETDSNKIYLTIIKHDNQNPGYQNKADTLVKDTLVELINTKIDLYFTHRLLQFPYDIPTQSIFKNPGQDKECNMNNYPNKVKCYTYDSLNRVTKMQIDGSGTTGNYLYKYDNLDRIIQIQQAGHTITISYNSNSTINEIRDDGGSLQKQFYFYYKIGK